MCGKILKSVIVCAFAAFAIGGCDNGPGADNDLGTDDYTLTTYASPSNGGEVSSSPSKTSYTSGDSVTVTATAYSGYTFTGWSGASTSSYSSVTISMTESKTLTANFQQQSQQQPQTSYTVTFSVNGGSGSSPSQQTVNAGYSITLPSGGGLSRNGYTFSGWNTNSSGTGSTYSAGSTYTPSGNVTLYAKWDQSSVETVRLNENVPVSGSISGVNEVKYSMAVTSGLRYRVYWGDTDNGGGSADVGVGAYYSNGSEIFKGGYSSSNSQQFTADSSGTVEIRVYPLSSGNTGTFTIGFEVVSGPGPNVDYGGETYQTVVIGTQTWFARNLNYDVPDNTTDVCYNNSADSCAKYGRLYKWETAMNGSSSSSSKPSGVRGVCPAGWHIPSDTEWTRLTDYVGGTSYAGTTLKSSTGWNSYSGVPVGTDDYGFSALPGGRGLSGGGFYNAGGNGYWWSATENDAYYAWLRDMGYGYEHVGRSNYVKSGLFSVRCLQD